MAELDSQRHSIALGRAAPGRVNEALKQIFNMCLAGIGSGLPANENGSRKRCAYFDIGSIERVLREWDAPAPT